MDKLEPIKDTKKTEKIIAALKAHVVQGNLKTGTEFPSEKELALQLGVSRFSLREALRVAEAQGLIEISRGRRAKVAEPSASAAAAVISLSLRRSSNALVDLAEARLVLETYIARAAAERITAAEIKTLEQTVEIIAANSKDLDLCVAQDMEFHSVLVRATRNVVFEIMLAPLTELLREARKQTTVSPDMKDIVMEHRQIIKALKARNSDQAAECMSWHLDRFRTRAAAKTGAKGKTPVLK